MMNCVDLYWMCLNGHCKNVFSTSWTEIAMSVIAESMILDGFY